MGEYSHKLFYSKSGQNPMESVATTSFQKKMFAVVSAWIGPPQHFFEIGKPFQYENFPIAPARSV